MSKQASIPLVVVDDHPMIIEGLKQLLSKNTDITIAASFTGGAGLISFLAANYVKIVLLDINLPDTNGIDLCKEIKKSFPDTIVLPISSYAERPIVLQMLQNGASGYLLKSISEAELLECIEEVLNGRTAFSLGVKELIARPGIADMAFNLQLTRRELEILKLIAVGRTTEQIAKHLFLSPLTVNTHRRNMMQKLGVNSSPALIKIAMENNWL